MEVNNAIGLRGKSHIAAGANVTFGFVEDSNGVVVDGFYISQLMGFMREVWLELLQKNLAPTTWGQGAATVCNFFQIEVYKHFPDLRLCENHWKVDYIATTNYPGWHRKFVIEARKPKKEDNESKE